MLITFFRIAVDLLQIFCSFVAIIERGNAINLHFCWRNLQVCKMKYVFRKQYYLCIYLLIFKAERVDVYLHNISMNNTALSRQYVACFGTWILYHTLRIMIMYLLSGFELELYSVHEFYYIYW